MASNVIALDVGEKRIGIAIADSEIPFPQPLTTMDNDTDVWTELTSLIKDNNVSTVVIGLPRNMQGEETKQSGFSREFAARLSKKPLVLLNFKTKALLVLRQSKNYLVKNRHTLKIKSTLLLRLIY